MIELKTTKRTEIINQLFGWLKSHTLSDGSWFRVNYITALSILALIEFRKSGIGDRSELNELIDKGLSWLARTRNSDGGCREALNLNVWDTALSIISVVDINASEGADALRPAGIGWSKTRMPMEVGHFPDCPAATCPVMPTIPPWHRSRS